MRTTKLAVSLLSAVIALTSVSTAFAYPNEYREDYRDAPHYSDRDRGSHSGGEHRSSARSKYHYKRGGHLPKNYYQDRRYYVNDWRGHGLRQPPRGHRWVEVDGRYILVAVATGVIASILLHNHHH